MPDPTTRRQWLFLALGGSLAASTLATTGGCGSILFPERSGQPRGGPLDWKVVALDGLGLFFFFVPGVIAFAVDFYNGTIFLPAHGHGFGAKQPTASGLVADPPLPPPPFAMEPTSEIRTASFTDIEPADSAPLPSLPTTSGIAPHRNGAPAAGPTFGEYETVTSQRPPLTTASDTSLPPSADLRLEQIPLPAGPDRIEHLERIVTAHAGQPVRLDGSSYHVQPLERIDHFWATLRKAVGMPATPS